MEKTGGYRLGLGDRVNATVVKATGGRRFELRCKTAPLGWKLELHSSHPEKIELGSGGQYWIAKVSPLHKSMLLHEGEYGRLPISDSMRARYISLLRALIGDQIPSGEAIADARLMVASIERRTTADWLTVWRILGEPETGDVKIMLATLSSLRTARKDAPEEAEDFLTKLQLEFGERLMAALERLETK